MNGEKAYGIGIAHNLIALCVSLLSERRWDDAHLSVRYLRLDDDGGLIEEELIIPHISRRDHVQLHADWITSQAQMGIQDGSSLWIQAGALYPRLVFCQAVEAKLRLISTGNPLLERIMQRLQNLQSFNDSWREGAFDPDELPFKTSLESQATLQQYSNQRTFLCPDGEQRVFSWHLRLTPNAWRIHFYPEQNSKTIIIGYIGPHLPTATDST